MKRTLVFAALCLLGCTTPNQPQPPCTVQQPPPAHPVIEGQVKSVTRADIRAIITVMRQHIIKEHGSFVPIYSVYINDRDNAGVTWCNNGVQTVTPVERVNGHWQLSTTVIERIITTGANFPT